MYLYVAIYFLVATMSLTTYIISLYKLLRRDHRPGLVRTALSRLVAACLYEAIGIVSIFQVHNNHNQITLSSIITLGIFAGIQILWQINSWLDVALTRKQPKHQRKNDGPKLLA